MYPIDKKATEELKEDGKAKPRSSALAPAVGKSYSDVFACHQVEVGTII